MPTERADKTPSTKLQAFLNRAHDRFKFVADAETQLRKDMLDDQRFAAGQQWDPTLKADREADGRPCLTIDRVSSPIQLVTNQQRDSRPAMMVSPVDSGADKKTAEIFEGIIRHIEANSHADVAYDRAFKDAATMGRGWFRVLTEYQDDLSFDQEIVIEPIDNAFTVYADPATRKPDKSDRRFLFIVQDVPVEDFEDVYGTDCSKSLTDFMSTGDAPPEWETGGQACRIAEYFYVEEEEVEIVQLTNGQAIAVAQFNQPDVARELQARGVGPKIGKNGQPRTRKAKVRTVKWAKINAVEVLEGNDEKDAGRAWPGKYIPVIEVDGDELWLDGKRDLRGIIRSAKDAQRMYNAWVSSATEQIALAPKAPFVGVAGTFKGHPEWAEANHRNFPYMEYEPVSFEGTLAPPPQRQQFEPPIQAMVFAIRQSDNDLKATTQTFDASLGERGPEQSGKAIESRKQQGYLANSHFLDNLRRSHGYLGTILIDLIPKIYDAARVMRIIGTDGTSKTVQINQPFQENGVERIYDLGVGRYDVRVTMGRSYTTRRQEAVDAMVRLVEANPQMFPIVGDLMVSMMDFPDADKIAERLKKALPPELAEPKDGQTPIPPELQMQMQQAQQMIDALTQKVEEMTREREAEGMKLEAQTAMKQMEVESRERIAALQAQTELLKTEATLQSREKVEAIKTELERLGTEIQLAHEHRLADKQRAHETALALVDLKSARAESQADRAHDTAAADRDRQHDAETTDGDRRHQAAMAQGERSHQASMQKDAQAAAAAAATEGSDANA